MLDTDALRALAARYLSADPSYRLAREALAAANEIERLYQIDYDYAEMRNVIHILLEGLDEHWMTTGEGCAAVARAKCFLEADNALS